MTKFLYTYLRNAFAKAGFTAPEFGTDPRPSTGNTLDISIDSIAQVRPPFDVFQASVTLQFKHAADQRRDLYAITDATFAPDADAPIIIHEPPSFDVLDEQVEEKTARKSTTFTLSFYFSPNN